jgi:putative FmdB family regulatory protein
MPTYEYVCTECGEGLEVVQSFHDDPLTICPACEGRLRKLFSPVGVVFKGSGFYKTDSRGKQPAASTAKGGETKSGDSGTSTSTSSESSAPKKSESTASTSTSSSTDSGSKVA